MQPGSEVESNATDSTESWMPATVEPENSPVDSPPLAAEGAESLTLVTFALSSTVSEKLPVNIHIHRLG